VQAGSGIVTLITDFGWRDAYVGAMKGVLCSIMKEVRIVDITHEVTPQGIQEAAYILGAAYPWFPPGTVHLVVVDPGVGTRRRPLAGAADGQFFVGPDNSVLSAPLGRPGATAHLIEEIDFALPERSDTFHGRDVFAPVAAHLASGVPIERFGPRVADFEVCLLPTARLEAGRLIGQVVRIDRFGNAITNVPRERLRELGPGPYEVKAGACRCGELRRTFQDVAPGAIVALIGGDGAVDIAVNQGSAAATLGLEPGQPVEVRRAQGGDE